MFKDNSCPEKSNTWCIIEENLPNLNHMNWMELIIKPDACSACAQVSQCAFPVRSEIRSGKRDSFIATNGIRVAVLKVDEDAA